MDANGTDGDEAAELMGLSDPVARIVVRCILGRLACNDEVSNLNFTNN